MSYVELSYWIPLLPALGFAVLILFGRSLPGRTAGWLATLIMAVSSILALGLLYDVLLAAPNWDLAAIFGGHHQQALIAPGSPDFPFRLEWNWLSIKGEAGIPLVIYIDALAAVVTAMVALASLFIHLFSIGYMWGEERYHTFFAYLQLFSAAMLAFVLAGNFFHSLLSWEVMGLMSYLLIGFLYKKKTAQQAQKKAFTTTKLADLGFMLGLFWLYHLIGNFDLADLASEHTLAMIPAGTAAIVGLLVFVAAMGKSAQFPLHVWLLDAMEGPTPVSAMIHAATMVSAGVYLTARFYPLLMHGNVLWVVALVGATTALFAAVLAPAFADVKKILAWSTVSQLGYMFLGLGVFGWAAAMFHLVAHAFFKALLFLGSGSMIHGAHTQDIFEMDRLKKYMPWTYWTFLVGALALMGIPPFAGFWSKDLILHAAEEHATILWLMGLTAAFFTAFYTTRLIVIAFHQPSMPSPWKAAEWTQGAPWLNLGKDEVEPDPSPPEGHHPHESGAEMVAALVGLATLSILVGLWGSPLGNYGLLKYVYWGEMPEIIPAAKLMTGYVIGTLVALSGIGLAWYWYSRDPLKQRAPLWLTRALQRRLYIDEFYYKVVAAVAQAPTYALAFFDRYVIDLLVDLAGYTALIASTFARYLASGRFAVYAFYMLLGALALYIGGVR
ncbi:NADH-quinone oxidoreductase subunit 5 family protein [Oceanithermus sp.]